MNDARALKDAVYEQFSRVGKALSSPKRIEVLELLCQGPKTVEGVAQAAATSMANASQHLLALRAARLVDARKFGRYVEYRIAVPEICNFLLAFRKLAESRLAEIGQAAQAFETDRAPMERLSPEDLLARARTGDVVLLDVRPESEFLAGHLPGALSVPVERLAQAMRKLPRDRQVIAYCRGPYCGMAVEAVQTLRAHGFSASRFELGVPDWRAMGLPVEETADGVS